MRTDRRKLMKKFGLPLTYEQLKYIENPSTAYILIPNIPIKDSMIVEIVFRIDRYLSDCAIFQSFVGIDANKTVVNVSALQIGWSGNNFAERLGKAGIKVIRPKPKYGVDCKFVFSKFEDKSQSTLNGTQLEIGSYYYGNPTLIHNYDDKETFQLYLFNNNKLTVPSKSRIYNFIYSSDGNRLVELIPCKRKSDGVIGMYDLVGRKFYTSPNGVAFTGG